MRFPKWAIWLIALAFLPSFMMSMNTYNVVTSNNQMVVELVKNNQALRELILEVQWRLEK